MKLGIVGSGGVGGYVAARWVEAGLHVRVLTRRRHVEAINELGLRLSSPLGDARLPVPVGDDPGALSECELVIFTTKSWQLPEAVDQVAPHLSEHALVFGLQNGVSSVEELRRRVPTSRVLGGTCRIISLLEEPGLVRHVGVEPILVFGEPEGGLSPRVQDVESALDLGSVLTVRATADIQAELWRKFIFFAPVSAVGSVTGLPIGQVRTDSEARLLLEASVSEAVSVGKALGVELSDTAVEEVMAFIDRLPEDGTSSMQRDFEAGRRTELDALAGTVVRLGGDAGVGTPTFDTLLAKLMPREQAAREYR